MNRAVHISFALALLSACGGGTAAGTQPTTPPAASAAAPPLVKAGEAKVGDHTKCLVGSEEFVVSESSAKYEFEGKTYYFCCAPCVATFKADPKKYLQTQ